MGKQMEIGSVYEMDPKCIEKLDTRKIGNLHLSGVEKYKRKHWAYTASAREAISLALYSMEKEIPRVKKTCLMPAYMCDTVFLPFVRSGWKLVFYHIDKAMKADQTEIECLIAKEKPSLFFIHDYYGVDTWSELRPFLKECQKKHIHIMEDVTQAYYLEVNTQADYVVGSLRKWYAVADGGFLTTNHKIAQEAIVKDDTFAAERFAMLAQKWRYLEAISGNKEGLNTTGREEGKTKELQRIKAEYLAKNRELEERLDAYEKITDMSDITKCLLAKMEEICSYKRRSENCLFLQQRLKEKASLIPVMEYEVAKEDRSNATAPLYFPVYMKNRKELQEHLRKQDIYVPVLWPIAKENQPILNQEEQFIYSHIAAIPLDQRYGRAAMERIVEGIEEYEGVCV